MKRYIYLTLLLFFLRTTIGVMAAPKRFTVMGFGDSITEGVYGGESYLYPLWERLFTAGYDFDFVGPKVSKSRIGDIPCCGYSGHTVEFLNSICDSVYRLYPADIVLIHAGHNHFAEERPVPGMISAYKEIFRKIWHINPQAHIVLAKVTLAGKLPKYSYISELNRQIDSLARQYPAEKLSLVDMSENDDWHKYTVADRVHPNEAGRERMANIWFHAIEQIVGPSGRAYHPEMLTYKKFGKGQGLRLHCFRPERSNHRALCYFFAGGFQYGSPLQFYREARHYSELGYTVFCAEYRTGYLYKTGRQEAFEDARDALRWIRQHARKMKIHPDSIAVAGASAGGTLTALLSECGIRPNLAILYYPVVRDFVEDIRPGMPPVLFMLGDKDPLTSTSQAERLRDIMLENGNKIEYHIMKGKGHPLFYYRRPLTGTYYEVLQLTDDFLSRW